MPKPMLFNSYPFLFLFLPVTLAGFFVLGRYDHRAAAAWLALASLSFYAYWEHKFVPILLASIAWNFGAGYVLHQLRQAGRMRLLRFALFVAVGANLIALGYFKYINFFISVANDIGAGKFSILDIVLPLGISFFTFTQIAFLVDTARGEVKEFNFVHYVLFVTYFPHLIAGPILHHKQMMPQFGEARTYKPNHENFAMGFAYFAIGLAKKCILADSFAPDASGAFALAAKGTALGLFASWKGALAYTLQLYFDFSGYVDMAIGLSLMFGIRLPLNFNSPYRATNIIDFWRRWHMTLSTFLRDYLYIPLGGSRHGSGRRYLNLMTTMLLGGLWHGAAWTFVIWGGLHGLYLCINHAWQAFKPADRLATIPSPVRIASATCLTFIAVVVAWVFFRAPDVATALRILKGMAGLNGIGALPAFAYTEIDHFLMILPKVPNAIAFWNDVALYAVGLIIVFFLPNSQQLIERSRYALKGATQLPSLPLIWKPNFFWAICMAIMIAICLTLFTGTSEFLYFQF